MCRQRLTHFEPCFHVGRWAQEKLPSPRVLLPVESNLSILAAETPHVQTMLHEPVGQILIVVHSSAPPKDDEWDAFVRDWEKGKYKGVLVSTPGATPSSGQRNRLRALLQNKDCPIAVISKNPVVRTVLSVISLFFRRTHAFAPEDVTGALAFLNADPAEQRAAIPVLHRMQAQMDMPSVHAA